MKFDCPSCGRTLNVKDEYAGKKARCPGCKEVLTVPFAPEAAAPAARKAPPRGGPAPAARGAPPRAGPAPSAAPAPAANACPSCGGKLPPKAVFCVACGYDLRTGQQLQTVTSAAPPEEEQDAPAGEDQGDGQGDDQDDDAYNRDERG